ncbi:cation:proton antiporter [Streptomyces sp. NPDC051287]|uniref:cation:proton antiporter n=1 Tax=Streptomyces sp. NPDC051287 TaxID=3365648 RepID=UPI0037B460C2
MKDVEFVNLLAVTAVGLHGPLLLGLRPSLRLPSVVLEIVLGIIVGPSLLDWVKIDEPVDVIALLGLAFLLFLAGMETDVHRLRGRTLHLALLAYAFSLVIGLAAGLGFGAAEWVKSPLLVVIMLASTSSGLVASVLKGTGAIDTELGQTSMAGGAIADFGAVVLLSLAFSSSGGSTGGRAVLLATFGLVVAGVGVTVWFAMRSRDLRGVFERLADTTAEIRIRAAVVLLVGFVALAEKFGLESILGAFLAGALIGFLDADASSHPHFRVKLEAIGYGFLIPVFFVTSGIRLDLRGLFASPSALLRVLLFTVALLVSRALPALLYRKTFPRRHLLANGLLMATSLPVIVSATQIGIAENLITPVNGAALTCAGVLSVMIFPVLAVRLLQGGAMDRNGVPEHSRRPSGESA